jgi:hypothetical protein
MRSAPKTVMSVTSPLPDRDPVTEGSNKVPYRGGRSPRQKGNGGPPVSDSPLVGFPGDRRNVPRQERELGNAVCFIHWGTFRLSPGPSRDGKGLVLKCHFRSVSEIDRELAKTYMGAGRNFI